MDVWQVVVSVSSVIAAVLAFAVLVEVRSFRRVRPWWAASPRRLVAVASPSTASEVPELDVRRWHASARPKVPDDVRDWVPEGVSLLSVAVEAAKAAERKPGEPMPAEIEEWARALEGAPDVPEDRDWVPEGVTLEPEATRVIEGEDAIQLEAVRESLRRPSVGAHDDTEPETPRVVYAPRDA